MNIELAAPITTALEDIASLERRVFQAKQALTAAELIARDEILHKDFGGDIKQAGPNKEAQEAAMQFHLEGDSDYTEARRDLEDAEMALAGTKAELAGLEAIRREQEFNLRIALYARELDLKERELNLKARELDQQGYMPIKYLSPPESLLRPGEDKE